MTDYIITNDTLIRKAPTFICEGSFSYYIKETPIITKEEFIACYNAWIKNTHSI